MAEGYKHTENDLYQMQSLPLDIKIRMSESRIRGWIDEYGEDGAYIAFSGGKDSTVLKHLVRRLYPNVVAVFVNTGLEYPSVGLFARRFEDGFLKAYGIKVPPGKWVDPMKIFARIYGEYDRYHDSYKWQSLSKCAKYYGYEFKAHDSLEDVKATLYCYKKMTGGKE